MTTPIGKLLLQYTKLPLDVIQYCIEPCFGVTEKEVRENRRKLMVELQWVWMNNRFMWMQSLSRPRRSFPDRPSILIRNSMRTRLQPNWVADFMFVMERQFSMDRHSQSIMRYVTRCVQYAQTLPFPREEEKTLKRKSCLWSFVACMNFCTVKPIGTGIRVNLKRKDVALYTYY